MPLPLEALSVWLVTDGRGDVGRIERLVAAVCRGGVRAVQLREPELSARTLAELCVRVRAVLAAVHGVLFVNDRVDIVAAGFADGVQLGGRSLQVRDARRVLGERALIGASVHSEEEFAAARGDGADLAVLAPVWPTTSKPGVPGLGVERSARWTAAAGMPVVWLGGVGVAETAIAGALPAGRPVGLALRSGLSDAADPAAMAALLVQAWHAGSAPDVRATPSPPAAGR